MDTLHHSWGQSDTLRGGGRGLEGEPPPKIASAEAYIGGWPLSGPVPPSPPTSRAWPPRDNSSPLAQPKVSGSLRARRKEGAQGRGAEGRDSGPPVLLLPDPRDTEGLESARVESSLSRGGIGDTDPQHLALGSPLVEVEGWSQTSGDPVDRSQERWWRLEEGW